MSERRAVERTIQTLHWAVAKTILTSEYTVPEVAKRLGWPVRRLRAKLNNPKRLDVRDMGAISWAAGCRIGFGLRDKDSLDAELRWEPPKWPPHLYRKPTRRCLSSAIALDLYANGLDGAP